MWQLSIDFLLAHSRQTCWSCVVNPDQEIRCSKRRVLLKLRGICPISQVISQWMWFFRLGGEPPLRWSCCTPAVGICPASLPLGTSHPPCRRFSSDRKACRTRRARHWDKPRTRPRPCLHWRPDLSPCKCFRQPRLQSSSVGLLVGFCSRLQVWGQDAGGIREETNGALAAQPAEANTPDNTHHGSRTHTFSEHSRGCG